MNAKWNWFIILALLLGLVFTGPRQTVSAAPPTATADFTFESSPNPSNYGQPVTFIVSATGTDSTYQLPPGNVDFYDNGVEISGCQNVKFNFDGNMTFYELPAKCTTSSLAVGTHTITASFDSLMPAVYADETITLSGGQTVNDAISLTIYPDQLVDVMLTKYYTLPLTAYYPAGGGGECTNCTWYVTGSGEMPDGIGLGGSTGVLQGTPLETGVFTFTIVADDGNGARGSQEYTWTVTKVKTVVNVPNIKTSVGSTEPTSLGATASHPDPYYSPRPTGKMSFSVNGVPVPGCSGTEAKSTNSEGAAYCTSYLPTGLAAGSYEILAEFTPDAVSSTLYEAGSGKGTLQVDPPQAVVSGRVFMDDNQNAAMDEGEVAQGTWYVYLNQDCDGFLDWNTVTYEMNGEFSFKNVPIDNHTYCLFVDLNGYSGYVQTTPYNNLTLVGYQYLEIGVYYPHISIQPSAEEPLLGRVGDYFEQVFQVSGGKPPYTVDPVATLPDGLSFDKDTLTLSGTPTSGGFGQLQLSVVDSDGLMAEKTYQVMIQAEGAFELTSSANPSIPGEEVTFTLSGSGDAVDPNFGPIPPIGMVTFFDGDELIEGCNGIFLNVAIDPKTEEPIFGDYPATCTTSALTEGSHTIEAFFSYPEGWYSDATRTLTQQVGGVSPLTITTESLPDAAYQTQYSQQLSASGGTEPYTFTLQSGSLPIGITLSSSGLLSGYSDGIPGSVYVGPYPITIQVEDAAGVIASRDFSLVLGKGTPIVLVNTSINNVWSGPITLTAEVMKETPYGYFYSLDGTVAFFVDDNPVPGCQAVPNYAGYYECSGVRMDLIVGTHTVRADFTPSALNAPYYFPGSDSTQFGVQPLNVTIQGSTFKDANQNGDIDEGEYFLHETGWTVNLDQGCDGTVEYTTTTSWGGFAFNAVPVSGQCHRITVVAAAGYQQTAIVEDFVPRTAPWIMIGFYYPTITLSPSTYELPSGTQGVEYSQTLSASGGSAPYTYTISEGNLPDGLSLSPEGVLSGTPTALGYSYFTVRAEDANHAVGSKYYNLSVKANGVFSFTSSSNPSTAGEAVTFTVSATGEGAYPPLGTVTFSADGTPIEGCSDLRLNIGPEWGPGEFPAICTTGALVVGSHQITAAYTDWSGYYHVPSLALTQVVQEETSPSADLSITKLDKTDPVKPGAKLDYILVVSNAGPDTAESLVLVDKLDVTTTFSSVSAPKGWNCSYDKKSGKVTCTSDSLAAGASATIKITVTVNKTAKPGKELVNNASITSATFDPDLLNNSVVQKTLVVK